MLVVANTVRASFVRGSEETSDSQLSMSACDSVPEDDSGTTSVAEMESEVTEPQIFSRSSCSGWGAVVGLEGEEPITFEEVYGGG